jgi:hypothetical protein
MAKYFAFVLILSSIVANEGHAANRSIFETQIIKKSVKLPKSSELLTYECDHLNAFTGKNVANQQLKILVSKDPNGPAYEPFVASDGKEYNHEIDLLEDSDVSENSLKVYASGVIAGRNSYNLRFMTNRSNTASLLEVSKNDKNETDVKSYLCFLQK